MIMMLKVRYRYLFKRSLSKVFFYTKSARQINSFIKIYSVLVRVHVYRPGRIRISNLSNFLFSKNSLLAVSSSRTYLAAVFKKMAQLQI